MFTHFSTVLDQYLCVCLGDLYYIHLNIDNQKNKINESRKITFLFHIQFISIDLFNLQSNFMTNVYCNYSQEVKCV